MNTTTKRCVCVCVFVCLLDIVRACISCMRVCECMFVCVYVRTFMYANVLARKHNLYLCVNVLIYMCKWYICICVSMRLCRCEHVNNPLKT